MNKIISKIRDLLDKLSTAAATIIQLTKEAEKAAQEVQRINRSVDSRDPKSVRAMADARDRAEAAAATAQRAESECCDLKVKVLDAYSDLVGLFQAHCAGMQKYLRASFINACEPFWNTSQECAREQSLAFVPRIDALMRASLLPTFTESDDNKNLKHRIERAIERIEQTCDDYRLDMDAAPIFLSPAEAAARRITPAQLSAARLDQARRIVNLASVPMGFSLSPVGRVVSKETYDFIQARKELAAILGAPDFQPPEVVEAVALSDLGFGIVQISLPNGLQLPALRPTRIELLDGSVKTDKGIKPIKCGDRVKLLLADLNALRAHFDPVTTN